MRAIVAGDPPKIPAELAAARLDRGASRQDPKTFLFDAIRHYVYAGDTALHVAAAAYREKTARRLIGLGADVHAANRRGDGALHYAVDGIPGAACWNPAAQSATIVRLLEAGANPNAADKGGATPLHRAVRNRCAAAVRALLDGGADPRRPNQNGSTPFLLATKTTGRGGSGSAEAKAEQAEILRLLESHGAAR
jgi:hypothetical protein